MARTKCTAKRRANSKCVRSRRESGVIRVDDKRKTYSVALNRGNWQMGFNKIAYEERITIGKFNSKLKAIEATNNALSIHVTSNIKWDKVILTDNRDSPPDDGILFRIEYEDGYVCELVISSECKDVKEEKQPVTEEEVKNRRIQAIQRTERPNIVYDVMYRKGHFTSSFDDIIFDPAKHIGLFTSKVLAVESGSAAFLHYVDVEPTDLESYRFVDNRNNPPDDGVLLRAEDSDGDVHIVLLSSARANPKFQRPKYGTVDELDETAPKKARLHYEKDSHDGYGVEWNPSSA